MTTNSVIVLPHTAYWGGGQVGAQGPQRERSERLALELVLLRDARETLEKGFLCDMIFLTVFFF